MSLAAGPLFDKYQYLIMLASPINLLSVGLYNFSGLVDYVSFCRFLKSLPTYLTLSLVYLLGLIS